MYSKTADFYDICMREDYDYDEWTAFIIGNISTNHIKGVDLGCGTGNITYRLARSGKNVVGVDSSPEMLTVAQQRSFSGRRPMFCMGNAICFTPIGKVSFVTAVCDVVNYMSFAEVEKLIKKVGSYLEDNGEFIFDITSIKRLEEIEKEGVFYTDTNKYTRLWIVEGKNDCTVMNLTYFVPEGKELFRRFDEKHILYKHDHKKLNDLLEKNGFSVTFYGDIQGSELKGNEDRIYFKAVKKKKK